MMNFRKFTLLLFGCFMIAIAACKKDDAPKTPDELTASEKISRAWAVNIQGTSSAIGLEDTYKDIVLTFNANGTYTMSGADDLAYSGNKPAPNSSGNYVINDTGTEIIFDNTKTVKVTTLTEQNLIFNFTGKEATKFSTDVTIEYNMIPK